MYPQEGVAGHRVVQEDYPQEGVEDHRVVQEDLLAHMPGVKGASQGEDPEDPQEGDPQEVDPPGGDQPTTCRHHQMAGGHQKQKACSGQSLHATPRTQALGSAI